MSLCGGATLRVFPFLAREKKSQKSQVKTPGLLAKEGIKKQNKNQCLKKKAKNLSWLANFFLGKEGFSEYFDLGILLIFFPDVLPLSFFFLKKYHPEKKTPRNYIGLPIIFLGDFCDFLEKSPSKKKKTTKKSQHREKREISRHTACCARLAP